MKQISMNYSPAYRRACYRVALNLLGALIEGEMILFRLTGCELPALRRFWAERGKKTQAKLNSEHGTRIEYGWINER